MVQIVDLFVTLAFVVFCYIMYTKPIKIEMTNIKTILKILRERLRKYKYTVVEYEIKEDKELRNKK